MAAGAAAVLALLLGAWVSTTALWQALEHKSWDAATVLYAPGRALDPRITIVAIDEPTFQQLQQNWPFARSMHARLIERLVADGAAAIAFDVVFADPSADAQQDRALAQAIAQARAQGIAVVLASAQEQVPGPFGTLWTAVPPLPALLEAGALQGDAGVQPDADFVVREHPAHAASLAGVLAQHLRPGVVLPPEGALIAYRGTRGTFDTRSYYQVLEPGLLPAGFFQGKTVFIGRAARTTSELQHSQADLFNAPFASLGGERLLAGVELQATVLDNLLAGDALRPLPAAWGLLLVLLALVVLVPASVHWHPGRTALLALALVLGTTLAAGFLWAYARLWLAPLTPVAGVCILYTSTAFAAYAATRQRARQIHAMFAQYVPVPVVQRLIEHPELLRLGGEVRTITLLFTDLAHFTSLSERLSATQTVELLTAHFTAMTPPIHAQGGTVDKFIGDAIMAFWGAPLPDSAHAEHAVRAALAMQQAMEPLVAQLQARGLPPIQMRIGVHTGDAVVGNVGSAQRFSYTAIGDAVNLASRLEGANKAFGSTLLISEATVALLPAALAQELRALDSVIVKGKSQPVRVYTPCPVAAMCRHSQAALDALAARQWDEADRHLQALLALAPQDVAALRLQERVRQGRALAPQAPFCADVALEKL